MWNKDFFMKTWICCHHIFTIRNIKGSPSNRRQKIPDGNLNLQKEWRTLKIKIMQVYKKLLMLSLKDNWSFKAKITKMYCAYNICRSKNMIKQTKDKRREMEGASLVAQWLRIHLPMKGTWVRALVWEDPTCHRATGPVCHNYWACALEPASYNYWSPRT